MRPFLDSLNLIPNSRLVGDNARGMTFEKLCTIIGSSLPPVDEKYFKDIRILPLDERTAIPYLLLNGSNASANDLVVVINDFFDSFFEYI
jgi:hypothetical protein